MTDILDARLPLMHSGRSIALRDTYDAPDEIRVPLQFGGVSSRANALSDLPAHARIPVLHTGMFLSPARIAELNPGMSLLSTEDGSGTWEWEGGDEIEWPGESGVP
jgi:hypothetical protein